MKENSIEETIKQLELILKVRKEQKDIIECAGGSCINCDPDIKALTESIDILSDYKRVLKENEELKDTNCLVKRYFKLKDTNTYLQKENDELKKQRNIEPILINNKMYFIDNEIYNELLEDIKSNYTSVQKVKDKIEKLNDESHAEELEDIMNRKNYTITELVQYVLQELIEGKK